LLAIRYFAIPNQFKSSQEENTLSSTVLQESISTALLEMIQVYQENLKD